MKTDDHDYVYPEHREDERDPQMEEAQRKKENVDWLKHTKTTVDVYNAMTPPAESQTPITDAAKELFCPGRFFVFSEVSENLERQLAEANEKIQGLQDGIEYATAALMREKALADWLAGSFIALRNAEWLSSPGRAGDVVEDLITAWKETRNENVKEHAPLSAGASVDHGVDVETTEEHTNRAADRGCRVSTCSPSLFWCGWLILRDAWYSGGRWYKFGLLGFGIPFLAAGAWMLFDLLWGVINPLK